MEWSPIIPFKDLEIELCYVSNKRKVRRPTFNKLAYETIPYYYEKWGEMFRKRYIIDAPYNKNKKYYSMKEIQKIYIKYIIDNGIKPTGEAKRIIEHSMS